VQPQVDDRIGILEHHEQPKVANDAQCQDALSSGGFILTFQDDGNDEIDHY